MAITTTADSTGATIDLLGTINADHVTVYGNGDNDTVNVGNVTSGSETTILTYAGADTINISDHRSPPQP